MLVLQIRSHVLQDRGSVHAHIILWVHPEDVANVTNDITAHIPGTFDPSNNTITPPADGLQRNLYDMVGGPAMAPTIVSRFNSMSVSSDYPPLAHRSCGNSCTAAGRPAALPKAIVNTAFPFQHSLRTTPRLMPPHSATATTDPLSTMHTVACTGTLCHTILQFCFCGMRI